MLINYFNIYAVILVITTYIRCIYKHMNESTFWFFVLTSGKTLSKYIHFNLRYFFFFKKSSTCKLKGKISLSRTQWTSWVMHTEYVYLVSTILHQLLTIFLESLHRHENFKMVSDSLGQRFFVSDKQMFTAKVLQNAVHSCPISVWPEA